MSRANFSISLPREMARAVDEATKREHRTRSELIREALRTYFDRASFEARVRSLPIYTPTAAELRRIAKGRQSKDYLTLDEFFSHLDRARGGRRSQGTRARSAARARTTS